MSLAWLTVPFILFVIFIAPLWLFLHYRSKSQANKGLTEIDLSKLNQLISQTEKMTQRIAALETLLDKESPNWRAESGA